MKGKKFLAVMMAVMMIFAMCLCAMADSGESDKKEPVSTSSVETKKETSTEDGAETSESAEETEEEANEKALYASLYDSIEEAVLTYFEENNIDAENFSWPVYEDTTVEGELYTISHFDEDNSWSYFETIFLNYLISGKMYDTTDYFKPLPENENNIKLMNAILDGIVNWSELPENSFADPGEISIILYPYYENIPNNIDVSSAE